MQILTRNDAKILKVGQYFTGKPCKYGHIAYRYTGSGACSQCIRTASTAGPERTRRPKINSVEAEVAIAKMMAEKKQRDAVLSEVDTVYLFADRADVPVLNETAILMGMTRSPQLQREDLGGGKLIKPGDPRHIFMVHHLDVEFMRDTSSALWRARRAPEELPHIARLREVERELNDKPLPDWTEKP